MAEPLILTPYEYITAERTHNRFFPLPADYMELTKDGQKQARLSVLMDHSTPIKFVCAWELFRKLYLMPTPPGFFYHNFYPSPSFHYEMVYDCARYTRNLEAAPRGTAKCCSKKTKLLHISGKYISIEQINIGDSILSLSSEGKIEWKKVVCKKASGIKPLYRLKGTTGHSIEISKDHRVLTELGWKNITEISLGDRIAIPRTMLPVSSLTQFSIEDAELIGILLGDGGIKYGMQLTTADKEILSFFTSVVNNHGWSVHKKGKFQYSAGNKSDKKNNPTQWLREYGLFGQGSHNKRIPEFIWAASNDCLSACIRGLFDTDGTVDTVRGVSYTSINYDLARDVQLALLRLGIRTRLLERIGKYKGNLFSYWSVVIGTWSEAKKFKSQIGFRVKRKALRLASFVEKWVSQPHDAMDTVYFPKEEKNKLSISPWELRRKYEIRIDNDYRITRQKANKVLSLTSSPELKLRVDSDLYWDRIESIEEIEEEETYDIQVEGNQNFLADGIFIHNSTLIGCEMPLFVMLTKPYYRVAVALATDKMVEDRFDLLNKQFVENEFIREDFGILKPKRGDAVWNRHHMQLTNGSLIRGFSVEGRKRGIRPDLFILDDPEYDEESDSEETSMVIRQRFETFLFRQAIPMLEKGSSIFWVGTMIGRRSFLYHACYSEDPRFNYWNRKIFSSLIKDPTTNKESVLWEGKWDRKTLKLREQEIGHSAFMAEFMNDPTSTEERTLRLRHEPNEYYIEDHADPSFQSDPLHSNVRVVYNVYDPTARKWVLKESTTKELYKGLYRIITFDPAQGTGPHHDYSCIMVIGFDHENCMWLLDMWMGRAPEAVLLNNIYKMGVKWQPKILGIESVSMQIQIVESMETLLRERQAGGWSPKVMPIDYTKSSKRKSKADRISTLEWRFDAGKIKYPKHFSNVWPWNELYSQTKDFTYDMALLRFDDAIDAVAMAHYVVHGKGATDFPATREPTIADKIRAGQLNQHGIPILSGTNSNELDAETFRAIVDSRYKQGYNGVPVQSPVRPRYQTRKPIIIRHR